MNTNRKSVMKSREDDKSKNLTSWSLNRGKPEPSIENYIVNIDGSVKGTNLQQGALIVNNKVQTKKKLTLGTKPKGILTSKVYQPPK